MGTRGLVVEHLNELDDVVVGRQQLQCLDFFELLDLLDGLVLLLHTLDGHQFVGLDRLRHEHLRKSALALLGLQPVLVHTLILYHPFYCNLSLTTRPPASYPTVHTPTPLPLPYYNLSLNMQDIANLESAWVFDARGAVREVKR